MAQAEPQTKAAWTTIFTAFKVALDLKKLALAAAGILLASLGWWVLGVSFYGMRAFPEWKNYEKENDEDKRKVQWSNFKSDRASWNLLYELAGDASDKNPLDKKYRLVDAGYRRRHASPNTSCWMPGTRATSVRPWPIVSGETLDVPELEPCAKFADPRIQRSWCMAAARFGKVADRSRYRDSAGRGRGEERETPHQDRRRRLRGGQQI